MTTNTNTKFIEKFFSNSASFRDEINFRRDAEKISPNFVQYTKETKEGKFVRMYFVVPENSEVKGWR